MNIRLANNKDIENIVDLLKLSLGEKSAKKSIEVWRFKHVKNPFGASLILVGEENGQIIGVRAFMKWCWQLNKETYTAYRAVDTATHPNYQGKGIFKKLTLEAIEKVASDAFVFNTPNKYSKPGYLKMGWKEIGKINVAIVPAIFKKKSENEKSQELNIDWINNLCKLHNDKAIKKNKLFTPKSFEYLKWRYFKNPIQSYELILDEGYLIVYYLKKNKRFNELRVVELIWNQSKINKMIIKNKLICTSKMKKCVFISLAYDKELSLGINLSIGPILTMKKLKIQQKLFRKLQKVENWNYSLGDLELF